MDNRKLPSTTKGYPKIKAVDILEEERIAHAQHLEPHSPTRSDVKKSSFMEASPRSVGMTIPQPLRIGVIGAASVPRSEVAAITNPVSLCSIAAVASRNWQRGNSFIDEWCQRNEGGGDIVIKGGEKGFDDLILSQGIVDAIYIPLPQLCKDWTLAALRTGKHVLIDLPLSMTVADYLEMLDAAKKAGKFLMDGTMFLHHHRLEVFLEHISSREKFGEVKDISVEFCVNTDDNEMDGHVWPSKHDDSLGCIGSLGWYCVRFGLLVFTQLGSGTVKSVQVTDVGENKAGHPMDVRGFVKFAKDRLLSFHCSFVHSTRQKAEVMSDEKLAILYDFAFPHNNFTSFQVHEHIKLDDGDHAVESIDTIECGAGLPQDVMMWRTFSRLSQGIDKAVSIAKLEPPLAGSKPNRTIGWGNSPESTEATELSAISVQTQMIVDSLMESIARNGEEITLPLPEF